MDSVDSVLMAISVICLAANAYKLGYDRGFEKGAAKGDAKGVAE